LLVRNAERRPGAHIQACAFSRVPVRVYAGEPKHR
jgi:hypothetical protein